MADSRAHNLSNTISTYDGDAYLVVDKSAYSEAKSYKVSVLKGHMNVGDQTYTEDNYVTDSESLTDSIDALDIALKDVADDVSSLTSIKTKVVALSQSDILSLNTVPVSVIAAQGSDTLIELLSVSAKLTYGTSAYTSANELVLKYSTLSTGIIEFSNTFLQSGSTVKHRGSWTTNVVMKSNDKIEAYVPSANPTGGDGTIKLYITYRVITESAAAS